MTIEHVLVLSGVACFLVGWFAAVIYARCRKRADLVVALDYDTLDALIGAIHSIDAESSNSSDFMPDNQWDVRLSVPATAQELRKWLRERPEFDRVVKSYTSLIESYSAELQIAMTEFRCHAHSAASRLADAKQSVPDNAQGEPRTDAELEGLLHEKLDTIQMCMESGASPEAKFHWNDPNLVQVDSIDFVAYADENRMAWSVGCLDDKESLTKMLGLALSSWGKVAYAKKEGIWYAVSFDSYQRVEAN